MRIAYLLDTFPAVSETFVAREISALRRCGCEIDVFALRAGAGATTVAVPQRPVASLLRAASALSPAAYSQRWQAVGRRWWNGLPPRQRDSIDHIHGGFASHPAAIAQGAAFVAKRSWSFSGHARDLFVRQSALQPMLHTAAFASACTRAGVELLQVQAGPAGASIIYAPHGLTVADYDFRSRRPQPAHPLRLLSVGRLIEKKGFSESIKTIAALNNAGLWTELTIIGDGPLRQGLLREIEQSGLDDRVRLESAMPHHAVVTAMESADCLLFSGRVSKDGDRDGLPNVLLEAAALGLPIVATSVGSVGDFLDDDTAWLCAPGDGHELAARVQSLYTNWQEANRRAAEARLRLETRYNVNTNIETLRAAFAAAIASSQSRQAQG